MEDPKTKIERFYSLIKNKNQGDADTRYRSWEWCHEAFVEANNNPIDSDKDILSLHLAFYLASWGMYRGSSYLLQRDYKAHLPAVDIIMEERYSSLWNFVPSDENSIREARNLLFGKDMPNKSNINEDSGLYWRIKYSYSNYEGNEDTASDTLTTKILMGTFACIPAFDRFVKEGIKAIKKSNVNIQNKGDLSQSIECKRYNGRTFEILCNYVKDNLHVFKIDDANYPPMKCLDMFLWEIGYEIDEANHFEKLSAEKRRN